MAAGRRGDALTGGGGAATQWRGPASPQTRRGPLPLSLYPSLPVSFALSPPFPLSRPLSLAPLPPLSLSLLVSLSMTRTRRGRDRRRACRSARAHTHTHTRTHTGAGLVEARGVGAAGGPRARVGGEAHVVGQGRRRRARAVHLAAARRRPPRPPAPLRPLLSPLPDPALTSACAASARRPCSSSAPPLLSPPLPCRALHLGDARWVARSPARKFRNLHLPPPLPTSFSSASLPPSSNSVALT